MTYMRLATTHDLHQTVMDCMCAGQPGVRRHARELAPARVQGMHNQTTGIVFVTDLLFAPGFELGRSKAPHCLICRVATMSIIDSLVSTNCCCNAVQMLMSFLNFSGGVREPAFVRWPGHVAAGATSWALTTTYE